MQTLVLSGVLSVLIFTKTFVDGALTMSYTGSNEVYSTTYSLKCEISGFSGQATMSKNGTLISQCFTSGCITLPSPPYSFRQVGTAIYVDFSTLAESENGIQWTCAHDGDTSVNFNVEIDFGEATTAGSTEGTSPDNPESNKTTTIIAAVLGSFLGLIACIGLMIFLYKCIGHQSESPGKNTPQEPRGPLKINNVEDHIIFEWESPKSDGGSKITEYIVELQGNNFDTWELVGSSYKKITLKVPMSQFKDKGVMSFRVRAKNAVGFSKPLLAQEPFNLQNSYALLADRPVQGRGPAGCLPRNSVGSEH